MIAFGVMLVGLLAAVPTGNNETSMDGMCESLQEFISSVKPDDTRVIEFHTSWGGGFKDSSQQVLYEKRCDHFGYEPAKTVCAYLMEHGAVEFAGNNAKRAIMCLSPGTMLNSRLSVHRVSVSLSYGTEDRGSLLEIEFKPDAAMGGMVLKIKAEGY